MKIIPPKSSGTTSLIIEQQTEADGNISWLFCTLRIACKTNHSLKIFHVYSSEIVFVQYKHILECSRYLTGDYSEEQSKFQPPHT